MIEMSDVERMSVQERLQAMELLWSSLSGSPDVVPSPDWHKDILTERLAKVERGEGEFLSLDEARARLRKSST
jgi:putative addiction module component (TIGR02574 family)